MKIVDSRKELFKELKPKINIEVMNCQTWWHQSFNERQRYDNNYQKYLTTAITDILIDEILADRKKRVI